MRMAGRIIFVTGTDTGVGKTFFTAVLAHVLREQGVNVAALKPICSGGRDDARVLQNLAGGGLSLDEVNPRHFWGAVGAGPAPPQEGDKVGLHQVVAVLQRGREKVYTRVVESGGGLRRSLAPV